MLRSRIVNEREAFINLVEIDSRYLPQKIEEGADTRLINIIPRVGS